MRDDRGPKRPMAIGSDMNLLAAPPKPSATVTNYCSTSINAVVTQLRFREAFCKRSRDSLPQGDSTRLCCDPSPYDPASESTAVAQLRPAIRDSDLEEGALFPLAGSPKGWRSLLGTLAL